MKFFIRTVLAILLSPLFFLNIAFAIVHHSAEITLHPSSKSLSVEDILQFSSKRSRFAFKLHKNLQVHQVVVAAGKKSFTLLKPTTSRQDDIYHQYEVLLPATEPQQITLKYEGVLHHEVVNEDSIGLISEQGARLFGGTYWLPTNSELMTFDFRRVTLPAGWVVASPVRLLQPQQEAYLMAGPFVVAESLQNVSGIPVRVYLLNEDAQLAEKFLKLLPEFLKNDSQKFGPYPYPDFAVIENFWETGFGMPGFTLLGSQVLRLPQILNSSLPHEVLHNWWGNGVYVDEDGGNWSEGLTSYLADHAEQAKIPGQARAYRLQTLMNYQDYTKNGGDFPLRRFSQRNGFSSQAVGYGKAMMFFHMLRVKLGAEDFEKALRDFYARFAFKKASYNDLQGSFQRFHKEDLSPFFSQMLDRTGAPKLKIVSARQEANTATSVKVGLTLRQFSRSTEKLLNYDLTVPVRFHFADGTSLDKVLELKESEQQFSFLFKKPLNSIEVDPEFDVFRELDPEERPLALSEVFGAKKIAVISSTSVTEAEQFMQPWQSKVKDGVLSALPIEAFSKLPAETEAVVLLGEAPEFESFMTVALENQEFKLTAESVDLFGVAYPRSGSSTVVLARDPLSKRLYVWVRSAESVVLLAPRLLHYGRYGVLVLEAKTALLKSTWPVLSTPLKVFFPN